MNISIVFFQLPDLFLDVFLAVVLNFDNICILIISLEIFSPRISCAGLFLRLRSNKIIVGDFDV